MPVCFGDVNSFWLAFGPVWASTVSDPGAAAAGGPIPQPAGRPEPMVCYIVYQVAIVSIAMLSVGVVHT
jgi:hypothetical protein